MAEIRNIDGSVVNVEHFERNEAVAKMLENLTAKNDAGRISTLAALYVTPEGRTGTDWAWTNSPEPFPWHLALFGAFAILQAEMMDRTFNSEGVPEPPKPTPAA